MTKKYRKLLNKKGPIDREILKLAKKGELKVGIVEIKREKSKKRNKNMKKIKLLILLTSILLICSLVLASLIITKKSSFKYETEIKPVKDNQIKENFDIQKAINNASASSTIYVEEGIYREIIYINKEINLTGEGMPFLNPVSKKNSYAIEIRTADIILSGFNIRNDGLGLYVMGIKISASHVTIENCNVFDTPIGIAIWSSNNIIVNCTFWGCEDEGIILLGSNNTIQNCVFYNCCDGIELQKSSDNTFINCRFLSNTHMGIDAIRHSNDNNRFYFCLFYDNPYGCYFKESKNNEFVNCTFLDNKIDLWEYNES